MSGTDIQTYSSTILKDDLYRNINALISQNLIEKTFPFFNAIPLPQDVNIVNGRHLGDINKIELELKAALIGAKSLKWIYGADAALIGLELKQNQSPVIGLANINNKNKTTLDAQAFYLLDQFTDNALELVVNIAKDDSEIISAQKKTVAQNIIKNIAEYDSGKLEKDLRENKRKNISNNLSKDNNVLSNVREAFSNITEDYTPEQKTVFAILNNYFIQQETGISIQTFSKEQKEKAYQTIKAMSLEDSPKLTRLFTESFLYSERMTHYNFEVNRIYTKEDLNKSLSVLSPSASNFEPKHLHEIDNQKDMEKLIEREIEIKPRTITHERRR